MKQAPMRRSTTPETEIDFLLAIFALFAQMGSVGNSANTANIANKTGIGGVAAEREGEGGPPTDTGVPTWPRKRSNGLFRPTEAMALSGASRDAFTG
jgi:hypothetical protein